MDTLADKPCVRNDDPLAIDADAEVERLTRWIAQTTAGQQRRGLVVAMSGGIDSSVCAALAVRALGPDRVYGLMLPERESGAQSTRLGQSLARELGIAHEVIDLTAALEATGCYRDRDAAYRQVLPDYGDGWRAKITLEGGPHGGLSRFRLVAESPLGQRLDARLPLDAYLAIVAATNLKQRLRKTVEYTHADRRNYAVLGTPNRLEHALGFFVRNGDGSADLMPIAHLYKCQVYALADALGLPSEIRRAAPTTDTYSLPQGQDEFYFGLPWQQMDRALHAFEHGMAPAQLAAALNADPTTSAPVTADAGRAILDDIARKRRVAARLSAPPTRIDSAA